jgi:Domain of unknown function (DUF4878)
MMNKIITTMFVAALLVTPHLKADETPQDVYTRFWTSVKEGKLTQAQDYLFPINDKEFLEQQKAQLGINSEKLRSGDLSITVIDSKVQGDWAFLVVHISITNNGKTDESIQYEIMARDKSKWKHVFKEKAGDASLSTLSTEDFGTLEKWWRANRDKYRKKK